MKTVGVVLSGGGARGAAHLGVLQALSEFEVPVSAISGVSAGAITGALFAGGYAPEEILETLKTKSYFGLTDIALLSNGLFSMNGLRKTLRELLPDNSFENLSIPLYVTATDILSGGSITFSSGDLHEVIIGSASVPVIFEAVCYKDFELLDGGLLNNLPVEPLKNRYDLILGSHVNKINDRSKHEKLNRGELIEKCFHLAIAHSVQKRSALCDIFIEPLLAGYGMFDMKCADDIFALGYEATLMQREKILKMI